MSTQKPDLIPPINSGPCPYDLLRLDTKCTTRNRSCHQIQEEIPSSPQERLKKLLSESGNSLCADCGSPDPKWVSLNIGSFICIKCSGVHRSLGAHISKVFSVKLDEWTDEQVDALADLGGNTAVNLKYEACIPENFRKPKLDASIEDRSEFIRRKYELQQFLTIEESISSSFPYPPSSNCSSSSCNSGSAPEKKKFEKNSSHKSHGLRYAFRNSWRRSDKSTKKSNPMAGMVEFIGLIKVNVVRGTDLAVRDVITSDPYVILSLGGQSVKTRVIKNNLNPVWNERLVLSIPEHIPPLKLLVYDKDTFTNDDFMGEAEIDIQPLVAAAKATDTVKLEESTQLGNRGENKDSTVVTDGVINLIDGKVKQDMAIKLQNVERGVLQIELECVLLTQ